MRITFILPFASLAGGIRVMATYARVLSEQGHEVYVLSAARSKRGWMRKLWLRVSGRKHKIKNKKQTSLLEDLGARHILYDPDQPFDSNIVPDADAVFATWWRTAQNVVALPASKGHKFYMLQDYEVLPPFPPEQVGGTYKLPLHKIAVSSWIRDKIFKEHGVNGIDVVPNAVDAAQFNAPRRAKSKPMTVGFLYSPHPRKQCRLAIDAIERARIALPKLRVIVFSKSPPTIQLPLPDWVELHLAPEQHDIPKLYQSCDLWLFTSAHEGFGLPLLEAMACRTPVLATPAGAAPDLIDGTNGVLMHENSDAEAFSTQIQGFAAMGNAEWQTYSDAAHQCAQRNRWPDAARSLIAAVEAAITADKMGGS